MTKKNVNWIVPLSEYTLIDDKIIKTPFSKHYTVTIKNKWNFNKDFITRVCRLS